MSETNNVENNNNNQSISADTLSAIGGMVESVANVLTGAEGTDLERETMYAEASYLGLRADIAEAITAAINSGNVLMTEKPVEVNGMYKSVNPQYSFGMVAMDHWRKALPESRQQHYSCDYCKAVWPHLASLVMLNSDGSLTYPLVDAFIKNSNSPVVMRVLDNNPDLQKAIETRGSRNVGMLPVGHLPKYFRERKPGEVGPFEHFHGCDAETFENYNQTHAVFADFKYVETLYAKLIDPCLNVDLLEKVFIYVEQKLGSKDHTALSRKEQLVEFIRQLRTIKQNSRHSVSYLWGMLQKKSHAWLQHVYGSILGNVLDAVLEMHGTEDLEEILKRVTGLLKKATSADQYKQKTAEASDQSVEQATKFLINNGYERSLERRLMPFKEIQSVRWQPTDVASEVAKEALKEESPISALAAARQALKGEKDPATNSNAQMDAILGKTIIQKGMSLFAFTESLTDYAEINLCMTPIMAIPCFVTSSVAEGNHRDLMHFDLVAGLDAHVLHPTTKQPVTSIANAAIEGTPSKTIAIDGIFESNRHSDNPSIYILQLNGLARNLYKNFEQFGSCILGSVLRSEYFGYSRAIVELSSKIKMQIAEDDVLASGIILAPGMVLDVVKKNGLKEKIAITSVA